MRRREALKVFRKLNMDVTEGKKHTKAKLRIEENLIIRSKLSHGRGEIQGKVPYYIYQQLKLRKDEFNEICSCTKEFNDYLELLKQQGLLP